MTNFILKTIKFSLIGLCLIVVVLGSYFILDPFRVLYSYNTYSNLHVVTNRDFVSTEMFIKNYDKYHYNSFIFGSSRTMAYNPKTWKRYLASNDQPFVFDASGESVYGINLKVKFLDENNYKIKNALVILCRDYSFHDTTNNDSHINIHPPKLTKESSISFQLVFLKSYFSPAFLTSFLTYKITGNYYEWLMKGFIEHRTVNIDRIDNYCQILEQEKEITETPDDYYKIREQLFYKRPDVERMDSVKQIFPAQAKMLKEIAAIFKKQGTDYKVIVGPLYDQIKLNKHDFNALKEIFGDNVFDFTGKNKFTENIRNYYETSHYRPVVGDSIFKIIYKSAVN